MFLRFHRIVFFQIYNLNTSDMDECAKKFISNQRIGLILFFGIIVGNLMKSKNDDKSHNSSSQKT